MSLAEGDEVWIKLPYGEFVIDGKPGDTVVLVAGGTGVSPFISFLAGEPRNDLAVRLLYGARTPELLIWKDTLDRAAASWQDFSWTAFIETGHLPEAVRGRLTVDAAVHRAEQASGLARTVFYLSGPPAMIELFESGLAARGVDPTRIRVDAWS
jgi:ferredoxin-NADP reductase